jgi:hypothetical protein
MVIVPIFDDSYIPLRGRLISPGVPAPSKTHFFNPLGVCGGEREIR